MTLARMKCAGCCVRMTFASAPKVGVEALADAPPEDPGEISAADTATEVRGAPRTVTLAQKPGQLQPFIVRTGV